MTNRYRFIFLIELLLALTPLRAQQNAITDTEWYQMFDGLELRDNKLAGLKSFTAYTSKRYKYYNTSTSQLVIGDSVHEQNTLRYFLHIPYDYATNPDKQYPLFAFIHGSGGCLYLPSNNECYGSARARTIPTSSFLDSTNYSLKMLGGYLTDADPTKDKPWYSCMDDNGLISAPVLTGVGDFAFVKKWFEWIKEHPEDDGFFILPLLNDETWWESMGYYTVDGQKVKQVEICNSYRVGFGEKVVNTGYGNTYKASELDLAIPLQLLIQLQDSLIANCRINADRQYVLGFSLGGIAVWDLLNHCPGRFAAAVASCSPSADPSPENCRRLIHENILAYLGDEGWVPKKMSQMAVDTINKLGGHAIARSTNSTWHGAGATIMSDEFESVLHNFLYGSVRKHTQDSIIAIVYQDCNKNGISSRLCDVENNHLYVDLGLSVKWATSHVGADYPEDYGDYFAFGETEPKDDYSWETYKWCEGTDNTLTKYCNRSNYGYNGFTDNDTVLNLEDDAAHVNWGGAWRIPTIEEANELRKNCTWTNMVMNGVKGSKVTGPNGNSIFLPSAGNRMDDYVKDLTDYGCCRSSTINNAPSNSRYIYFKTKDGAVNTPISWLTENSVPRCYGQTVRPVCMPSIDNSQKQLWQLTLYADQCGTPNSFTCFDGQQVFILATPMEGYVFEQWSDGNTDNPRQITVNKDVTFTAQFQATPPYLYTRSVTNGNFGTICLDKKMASFSGIETLYEVAGFAEEKGVALFPIEPNETIAGKPYIFKANANQIKVAMAGEAVRDTVPYNHFIGSFSGCNVPEGMYILINNLLYKTADGSNTIAANRAYFDVEHMESFNPTTAPAHVVFIGGRQAPTDNPSLHHSINSSLKVLKDGQFIIIKDNKMYNAQGIEIQ